MNNITDERVTDLAQGAARKVIMEYHSQTAEQHREHHEFYTEVLMPYIKVQIERQQRREAACQRLKEQVFLWAIIGGVVFMGQAVWEHTVKKMTGAG